MSVDVSSEVVVPRTRLDILWRCRWEPRETSWSRDEFPREHHVAGSARDTVRRLGLRRSPAEKKINENVDVQYPDNYSDYVPITTRYGNTKILHGARESGRRKSTRTTRHLLRQAYKKNVLGRSERGRILTETTIVGRIFFLEQNKNFLEVSITWRIVSKLISTITNDFANLCYVNRRHLYTAKYYSHSPAHTSRWWLPDAEYLTIDTWLRALSIIRIRAVFKHR